MKITRIARTPWLWLATAGMSLGALLGWVLWVRPIVAPPNAGASGSTPPITASPDAPAPEPRGIDDKQAKPMPLPVVPDPIPSRRFFVPPLSKGRPACPPTRRSNRDGDRRSALRR